jgi:hypothetical protein
MHIYALTNGLSCTCTANNYNVMHTYCGGRCGAVRCGSKATAQPSARVAASAEITFPSVCAGASPPIPSPPSSMAMAFPRSVHHERGATTRESAPPCESRHTYTVCVSCMDGCPCVCTRPSLRDASYRDMNAVGILHGGNTAHLPSERSPEFTCVREHNISL